MCIYIKEFALTSVIEHSCQQIEMTSGIYMYIFFTERTYYRVYIIEMLY